MKNEKKVIRAIHTCMFLLYMFSKPRLNYFKYLRRKQDIDFDNHVISQKKFEFIVNLVGKLFRLKKGSISRKQYNFQVYLGCSPRCTPKQKKHEVCSNRRYPWS